MLLLNFAFSFDGFGEKNHSIIQIQTTRLSDNRNENNCFIGLRNNQEKNLAGHCTSLQLYTLPSEKLSRGI